MRVENHRFDASRPAFEDDVTFGDCCALRINRYIRRYPCRHIFESTLKNFQPHHMPRAFTCDWVICFRCLRKHIVATTSGSTTLRMMKLSSAKTFTRCFDLSEPIVHLPDE